MWLILALTALLFWSGSDLFSKMGSKPNDKYSHWKMVIAVGLVMGIHAIIEMLTGTPVSFQAILYYLPASSMYILSMIFGYVTLRYIELSVSSPICNSSGALAAILCFLVLGQTIDGLSTVGVVLVCAGVLLLGISEYTENEEDAEDAQLVILSVGEDDEGEYLDVVEDDETLLEVSKLFEQRLSDDYEID